MSIPVRKSILNWLKPAYPWLLAALFLAVLINNRHSKTGTFNWMTPLWADQAGYYVYLPGLFIYHFDAGSFPEGIEEKMGDGFSLDLENNKVITRYSCGVAILQAPFFLIIHTLAGLMGLPQDGFSGIYHQVPNLAALFYSILGLFFLWNFLRFYYRPHIVSFTLGILFLGTNLYYYAVDSTGMSHIYSFSLFAITAWVTKKMLMVNKENQLVHFAVWSLLFALVVLVRPTNLFILPFLFTLDLNSFSEFWDRIKRFATIKNILVISVAFLVVFLPQFFYWKYVSGSYLFYSYGEYGFSNLTSPKIIEIWFSPNNGLFLYSPLYLLIVVSMVLNVAGRGSRLNAWIILATFFVLTYVFASWFIFSFGCGYGSRNFVEYNVMFALPLGYLLNWLRRLKRNKQIVAISLIAFFVIFNLKLVYAYNRCFQSGDWDFQEYASYLVKLRKYHQELELDEAEKSISSDMEYSKTLYLPVDKVHYLNFSKAVVAAEVIVEDKNLEALLVLSIESPDSLVYWNSCLLRDQIPDKKVNRKHRIEGEFRLPVPLPVNSTIAVYIWNREKETLTMNKLKITLE
jgi:hypothetical protein